MASRLFTMRALNAARPSAFTLPRTTARTFQSSTKRLDEAAAATVVAPVRRPVGAFRGGLFGFLLGSSVAAYSTYYWVLEEYRVANEMLTEDIYVRLCI
ncbi:hypothetical protein MMC10_003291 [Thelotrema lepadinum]|nr:hypothetical protein [Thelotrema lepadinum]